MGGASIGRCGLMSDVTPRVVDGSTDPKEAYRAFGGSPRAHIPKHTKDPSGYPNGLICLFLCPVGGSILT